MKLGVASTLATGMAVDPAERGRVASTGGPAGPGDLKTAADEVGGGVDVGDRHGCRSGEARTVGVDVQDRVAVEAGRIAVDRVRAPFAPEGCRDLDGRLAGSRRRHR